MNLWLKYFVYIIVICILAFSRPYFDFQMKANLNHYFILGIIASNIAIGLLLGLESLLCEIKKEGSWKLNIPKITIMGIFSLYFGLSFIYYGRVSILSYPVKFLYKYINMSLMGVFQLIFGYSIITSFYKINKKV